jgi:hypothetical protein
MMTSTLLSLLADAASSAEPVAYRYRFLLTPLPLWHYWAWLMIPLCIAVATVYKTIKCQHVRQVPKEAAVLTVWILAAMVGVAAGVWGVYMIFVQWT